MARIYGYARVSSREQNLNRQLDALERFGVARENIFADKASGKDFTRPKWIHMKEALQKVRASFAVLRTDEIWYKNQ